MICRHAIRHRQFVLIENPGFSAEVSQNAFRFRRDESAMRGSAESEPIGWALIDMAPWTGLVAYIVIKSRI